MRGVPRAASAWRSERGKVIGRLRRSTDFERALGTRACARSDHFAIHHLSGESLQADLSTGSPKIGAKVVDEFTPKPLSLGAVVPKRHARRAVTRNLIKRQIRSAAERHARHLAPGWWVVRLK